MIWQIAYFFEKHRPELFTDRQVKEALGYSDMNHARPKITNLIDRGFLKEIDRIHDTGTDRMVRRVAWFPQEVGLLQARPAQASFPFVGER